MSITLTLPNINYRMEIIEMKEIEKDKYDKNLKLYSDIVIKRNYTRERIVECLSIFEYFEDYEKCDHLLHILKEMDQNKNSKIGKETR